MNTEQEDKELEQRMNEHRECEDRLGQLYENLKVAQDFVWKRKLEDAERHFYAYCVKLAGATTAAAIMNVDFSEFRSKIREGVDKIIKEYTPQKAVDTRPVKAIYYEYDPDNEYDGSFFACLDYAPVDNGDDEWACDWEDNFDGPAIPEYEDMKIDGLGIHYCFLKNDVSLGKYSYAVVRIYLEFAKACFETHCPIPICIGFHDQSDISRVFPDSLYE